MTVVVWWRVLVAVALAAAGWYIVDLIGDNRELRREVDELKATTVQLAERAERLEKTLADNQRHDDEVSAQASRGIARNESLRRTDHAVSAIDKPWPAALRGRVFDNPDPTSGSTAPAGAAAAGGGDRDEVPQP